MIYLMVFCSDSCTQYNAQTKQSKRELYILNLRHFSSHFYHYDKTFFFFLNIHIFPQHKKYLCKQIEQIFFSLIIYKLPSRSQYFALHAEILSSECDWTLLFYTYLYNKWIFVWTNLKRNISYIYLDQR